MIKSLSLEWRSVWDSKLGAQKLSVDTWALKFSGLWSSVWTCDHWITLFIMSEIWSIACFCLSYSSSPCWGLMVPQFAPNRRLITEISNSSINETELGPDLQWNGKVKPQNVYQKYYRTCIITKGCKTNIEK